MNNKERSRNGAGRHVALDRQGLIWESRAPQAPPPSSLQRVIADSTLSPWLNLPGATSGTTPTLPVRPLQPSLLPSQPPAAFQEAPRPAAIPVAPTVPGEESDAERPPLFRGPAMRPAHPDANWLKPQTLEWRSDRDAMSWDDLPQVPPFSNAADRAATDVLRQALQRGGTMPERALLANTPPVRPAEVPPQAPPPLWQGRLGADLSDRAEDITIHSRQGNGTYLTSVGGRSPQPLDEGDVAALTDLPAARLQALAAQSEKSPPAAPALPRLAEPKAPQTPTEGKSAAISSGPDKLRMDRSWSELKQELAKATVETWREYPRTAEQAAANITMNGAELNEREVRMLYEMFHQKYPGWGKRPQVDPTPKKQMPLPPGTPVMEALKPHQLLKEANASFDEALSAYAASPAEWIVSEITGMKNKGFSYGPDHAWTKLLKLKPVYERMRYGPNSISAWAAKKDKEGTLDQYVGWKGSPEKPGLTWDDSADDGPWHQPVNDVINYVTGSKLKTSGSVEADIVVTHVDHGNRTITFEVNAHDELRAGSMARVPGKTLLIGDQEMLEDNSKGPFLYTTPLRWKWTETVNY